MKNEFALLTCAVFAVTGCAEPWKRTGSQGTAMIEGARIIPGKHCESSAMMNALMNLGYPVTEPMITGAGGALSFGFEKGTFPFISARNADMRERFFAAAGIGWHRSAPDIENSKDLGWGEIRSLLESGTPVIVRVDMRYLPYRYGGKYGPSYTSFGWHMVTLFGIDFDRGIAFVSDTEFAGLQTIGLRDLTKARTSRTKAFPPQGEYYWADKAPENFSFDRDIMVDRSVETVIGNYETHTLAALERYGDDLADLESYSAKAFLLPAVFEYMAGNIEDFGTGGASFRMLYRDFLAESTAQGDGAELAPALSAIDASIASWHALSSEFRSLSRVVKGLKKDERLEAYGHLRDLAENIYEREKAFYAELKKIRPEE